MGVRECIGGRREGNRSLLNECAARAAISEIGCQKIRFAVSSFGTEWLFFGLLKSR